MQNNMTITLQALNILGKPALSYSCIILIKNLIAIRMFYFVYNTTNSISMPPANFLQYTAATKYASANSSSNATGKIEQFKVISILLFNSLVLPHITK